MPSRKPRRLKVVAGTLKLCRDREELELPPVEGLPEAPSFLDVIGAAEFDRVARILHDVGVLAEADFGVLTAYSATWSGLVRQWGNGLQPKAAELTAFRQLANELALSPRARASLPSRKPVRPSKFDGIGKRP